jgi:hypothetical protein
MYGYDCRVEGIGDLHGETHQIGRLRRAWTDGDLGRERRGGGEQGRQEQLAVRHSANLRLLLSLRQRKPEKLDTSFRDGHTRLRVSGHGLHLEEAL